MAIHVQDDGAYAWKGSLYRDWRDGGPCVRTLRRPTRSGPHIRATYESRLPARWAGGRNCRRRFPFPYLQSTSEERGPPEPRLQHLDRELASAESRLVEFDLPAIQAGDFGRAWRDWPGNRDSVSLTRLVHEPGMPEKRELQRSESGVASIAPHWRIR
jgi:hypothetical protein